MRRVFSTLVLLVMAAKVSAHTLDEYMQSALVEIEPTQIFVSMNLTPGVEVADQVIAAIDTDKDGVFSAEELAAYAKVIRGDVKLSIDGTAVGFLPRVQECPPAAELKSGTGIIKVEFSTAMHLKPGRHVFGFENKHMPGIGEYLLNAGLPKTKAIRIERQERNSNQSAGEIVFWYEPSAAVAAVPIDRGDSTAKIWLGILLGVVVVAVIKAVSRGKLRG